MVASSIYENTFNSLLHDGNIESGVALFTEIIEQMPDDAEGYIYRAQCHARMFHIHEALEDIKHATLLSPQNGYAHYVHGNIRRQMLDIKGAIAAYTDAIEAGYYPAYNNRGVMLMRLKKYRAAYGDFTSVMEHDPTLVRAYHNRGLARIHLKQYEGAIADLEVGIAQDPEYLQSYLLLGTAYYMVGADERAKDILSYYSQRTDYADNEAQHMLNRIQQRAMASLTDTATAKRVGELPATEPLPTLEEYMEQGS